MSSNSSSIADRLLDIQAQLPPHVTLVAVSKTKPAHAITEALAAGQLDFGENRVQELVEKAERLANERIKWHHIGHLQTNKVKFIIPHVHLVHAVDSQRLLEEINRRSIQMNQTTDVLLQMHIAQESTKYGWSDEEMEQFMDGNPLPQYPSVRVRGLMGMATFTDDHQQVASEFKKLKATYDRWKESHPEWDTLSMGMSGDWQLAVDAGSTMVRIGSSIFGER